jgi:uncharacterized protein (TIGR02271 family)
LSAQTDSRAYIPNPEEVFMEQTQVSTGTIAAYFEDSSDARKAVDALQEAGFTSAHLGIAHRGSYTGTSTTFGNTTVRETEENEPSTWDKIKAWFSGNEPEQYADERTRGDQASREVTENPADRFDSGYDESSDLHGSFTSMSIPEDRARYFSHRFKRGRNGAVVTVQAENRREEAESILAQHNADFGEGAAGYDYSQESGEYNNERLDENRTSGENRNFQLLGEVLRVHKNRVNRGDVRIRKEVVTENQSVQVPVQREELVVERKPVNDQRPAGGTLGQKEIRVPLSEEQATLGKSTVVREEVSVSKKPVEQVRDLNADVRHEELAIDDDTKRERSA